MLPIVVLVVVALVVGAVGVAVGVRIASDGGSEEATPTTLPPEIETTTTEPELLAYDAEQLAAVFGDAVWRVESFGCDEFWTGTAFAIDDRHLVTNHHVVANSTRPILASREGDRMLGTVIGWSERPDIAVIRADDPLELWLDWAPTDELNEGQSLVALGYPVPETDFTATPGTILSFQSRTGIRQAIRTNAALDRGNSGGPALDQRGRVIGVVTEMAPNIEGFQLVPLIFTHDFLFELIGEFLADPAEPEVDCGWSTWGQPEPGSDGPETWYSDAQTYGDDPLLDEFWDACEAGDMEACDDLWWMSPFDSEYETFGDTCGGRSRPGGWCADLDELEG